MSDEERAPDSGEPSELRDALAQLTAHPPAVLDQKIDTESRKRREERMGLASTGEMRATTSILDKKLSLTKKDVESLQTKSLRLISSNQKAAIGQANLQRASENLNSKLVIMTVKLNKCLGCFLIVNRLLLSYFPRE